jgi:hypothetical protein
MKIEKIEIDPVSPMPLIAVLPYRIVADQREDTSFAYDPTTQLSIFAGGDHSRCRDDESIGDILGITSSADTKRDD